MFEKGILPNRAMIGWGEIVIEISRIGENWLEKQQKAETPLKVRMPICDVYRKKCEHNHTAKNGQKWIDAKIRFSIRISCVALWLDMLIRCKNFNLLGVLDFMISQFGQKRLWICWFQQTWFPLVHGTYFPLSNASIRLVYLILFFFIIFCSLSSFACGFGRIH